MPLTYLSDSPLVTERSFRVLDIDELTDEELRQVNLHITARWHVERLLNVTPPVDPPVPYSERFYIWKMLFQQMLALAGVLVGLVMVLLTAQALGGFSMQTIPYVVLVALIYTWFAYRILYSWQHTVVFSEAQDTGIRRKRNPWLLLSEKTPSAETAIIQTRNADRNHFTSAFNINSWYVTLDTPAQEDKFLEMGFVRDGARLRQTVIDWQAYLRSTRR